MWKHIRIWRAQPDESALRGWSKTHPLEPFYFPYGDYMIDPDIARLLEALNNKGPAPDWHDRMTKLHRDQWPTLWRILDDIQAKYK